MCCFKRYVNGYSILPTDGRSDSHLRLAILTIFKAACRGKRLSLEKGKVTASGLQAPAAMPEVMDPVVHQVMH